MVINSSVPIERKTKFIIQCHATKYLHIRKLLSYKERQLHLKLPILKYKRT